MKRRIVNLFMNMVGRLRFSYILSIHIKNFLDSDVKRRRPTLAKMLSEGIILQDKYGLVSKLKEEANQILKKGLDPFDRAEMYSLRYTITDMIDDLVGAEVYNLMKTLHNPISPLRRSRGTDSKKVSPWSQDARFNRSELGDTMQYIKEIRSLWILESQMKKISPNLQI